ncbi:hypothetical protein AWH04_04030 [Rhodococcus erythropolis]|nr:hypothetical protein AWH04_04030 [Rhodococcus erythropolis]
MQVWASDQGAAHARFTLESAATPSTVKGERSHDQRVGMRAMKAMYNRETKNLWIQHDDGSVDELGTAATKLIAYDKVAEAGYARSTDWRLCGDGMPFREMVITPKPTQ